MFAIIAQGGARHHMVPTTSSSSLCARGVCLYVSNTTSSLRILVDGHGWLETAGVAVHRRGTWHFEGRGLHLASTARGRASDENGEFQYHELTWLLDTDNTPIVTRASVHDEGHVGLSTIFPNGASGLATMPQQNCAALGADGICPSSPSTRFPSFDLRAGVFAASRRAGFLTWYGNMCRPRFGRATALSNHTFGNEGGPVVLYAPSARSTRQVAVVSPLTQVMTATQNVTGDWWHHGVGAELDSLPPGYTQSFVVFIGGREAAGGGDEQGGIAATGVTATLLSWGAYLRAASATVHAPTAPKLADPSLRRLGYWSDNGGYYTSAWFDCADHPERCAADVANFSTPEAVLPAVARAARQSPLPVPIGYFQLDAFWYSTLPSSAAFPNCIRRWAGEPRLFPNGVGSVHRALGWERPLHLYHSFFCPPGLPTPPGGGPSNSSNSSNSSNWYSEAGGWRFVRSDEAGPGRRMAHIAPEEAARFYPALLANASRDLGPVGSWEADFLIDTYHRFGLFRRNATAADRWLDGLAAARVHTHAHMHMRTPRCR